MPKRLATPVNISIATIFVLPIIIDYEKDNYCRPDRNNSYNFVSIYPATIDRLDSLAVCTCGGRSCYTYYIGALARPSCRIYLPRLRLSFHHNSLDRFSEPATGRKTFALPPLRQQPVVSGDRPIVRSQAKSDGANYSKRTLADRLVSIHSDVHSNSYLFIHLGIYSDCSVNIIFISFVIDHIKNSFIDDNSAGGTRRLLFVRHP